MSLCVTTLALGPRPKQGFARLWAKKEAWESHLVLPGVQKNVREWTLTLPSELPLWELESQMDSQIFRGRLQGWNPSGQRVIYIIGKLLKRKMSKMGLHDPFRHLKHKLWPKERSRIKLAIWLSTIKSQESTRFPCMQVVCDIPLESSRRGIQLYRPHCNWRSAHKVMGPQSCRSPNLGNFWTPIWESRNKMPFACDPVERHKV
jgi:hypothetical protein